MGKLKIKICGFTRRSDIEECIKEGVEIIGINFYEKSPRYVNLQEAKKLIENLPENVLKIGVFVNPDEKKLMEYTKILKLEGVQLHGNEPPSLIKKFKKTFPEKIVIKALRIKNKESLKKLKQYKPDFFLLDTYIEEIPGGTGKKLNYSLLEKEKLPWEKIFLAGGITPENVREFLKKFTPYGIDVASGVEIAPGVKDIEKVRKLIKTVSTFSNRVG